MYSFLHALYIHVVIWRSLYKKIMLANIYCPHQLGPIKSHIFEISCRLSTYAYHVKAHATPNDLYKK